MHEAIYTLCALTAVACALLLLRSYFQTRHRILLWSGTSFAGIGASNILLVIDRIVVPDVDLAIWRHGIALGAMVLLLCSLILESTTSSKP